MSIKSWLENIAKSFQPKYDEIRAWKFTPAQQELVDSIWANLGPTIQKSLWALITIVITRYGPETGQKLFQSILDNLKKQGVEIGA